MKKKNILSLFLLAIITILGSCSSDKESGEIKNQITFDALPLQSQKFIKDYFQGERNVNTITKDMISTVIIYKVITVDGFEIIFNNRGYWQEIDAPSGSVIPMQILPEPIVQTLNYSYHGYGVVECNTEGENYHVVLSDDQGEDGIEIMFNQSGEILSTSQN